MPRSQVYTADVPQVYQAINVSMQRRQESAKPFCVDLGTGDSMKKHMYTDLKTARILIQRR